MLLLFIVYRSSPGIVHPVYVRQVNGMLAEPFVGINRLEAALLFIRETDKETRFVSMKMPLVLQE